MVYHAIGLMSGSSLDGLDIVLTRFDVENDNWKYSILASDCIGYDEKMTEALRNATSLNAKEYLLLHTAFGHFCGKMVNEFLEKYPCQKVDVIASHGHTTFHLPDQKTTGQLGDGAAIAGTTGIPTVSDLRAMDVALGGEGAPIIPIGEQLLFPGYHYFLNIGGIANISIHSGEDVIAFDVCPANRVLNLLSESLGSPYDKDGIFASRGKVNAEVLNQLNAFDYYKKPYPKSLPNSFGTEVIYPVLNQSGISIEDQLATFSEHISRQIRNTLSGISKNSSNKILVTGGGAFNTHLVESIQKDLPGGFEVEVPGKETVNYKEALVMALMGVLRIRKEENVLASVTGASRDSVGGALWEGKK